MPELEQQQPSSRTATRRWPCRPRSCSATRCWQRLVPPSPPRPRHEGEGP
ncbi:MAG: hypothetical protein ACLSVD_08115 [Eggerthellaceae bacterium]